ncbi:MAG: hypothetical protein IJT54_05540 [Candidatus Methanomethylophilaceae archaeon]|nr:hypothetical protein [Candidatus Methanomethylophilaceae archaeon]
MITSTLPAGCLPQTSIITKTHAIIESSPESSTETNNPFFDLLRDNYDVAIITEDCYGSFLAHAITSVFPDTRNITHHINAIYPHQVDYSSDTIIVTQEKIDYLRNNEGKHRKWTAVFGTNEYNTASFKKLIDSIQCNIVYNVVVKGPDYLHPEVIMFDIICCTTGADGIQYDCTLGFRILIGGQKIELVTAY